MKYQLIPSIISKDQNELDLRLNKVKNYFRNIQLDVMDGKFVRNKSLDFDFKLPKKKRYEAHLMLKNPIKWIRKHKHKVNTVIIHLESKNLEKAIKLTKRLKKKVGIAVKPETPIIKLLPYLNQIDQVTILTVKPGKYGGKFIQSTLNKILSIRKLKPKLNIEVDGGIGSKHIKKIKKAGANIFISGSYLQNAKNTKKAVDKLKKLIK